MAGIKELSCYIPVERINVEDELAKFNYSSIEKKVFKKIYLLQQIPQEKTLDFIAFIQKPLSKMLKETQCQTSEINYMIHTHTSRVVAPFGESFLRKIKYQQRLDTTIAFSITLNNCASTITAIALLNQLIHAEKGLKKALLIAADLVFSPILRLIANVSVMGDAASIIMLAGDSRINRLIAYHQHIYGEYSAANWIHNNSHKKFEDNYTFILIEAMNKTLQKAGLSFNEIKLIIPHNVNFISWEKTRQSLNLARDKLYLKNIPRYGHCFGADIFINLLDALHEAKLQPGDFYLLVTVGLGATVAAAIFQY